MNESILIEILRKGILEIRVLSVSANKCSCKQVNVLANILHNIPSALGNAEKFDFDFLKSELLNYESKFGKLGDSYLDLF
ncbi:hypothetical protein CO057_01640 [Candidatus Uhrbacteria bacterium CG_4_9_14_0_2_um_filter_41_50]|uniref:Uncharacterized protein n=1 Tax=Candidatus Uhrbacteria bacterium CG_4_9_14_0_2_um_filter_41_50 TaxID=1975031 RepID=A0A2M8EPJ5_9BACT|nr:MAG: hypothetical protein COZ45_03375 [Candidatus Uhrbacteria bacterium CG_4_10_14_3_um_filter_41_21]PJB84975.1 MAG: hypothetical protein CO086_00735 [Candidatus Uhrbacteria bacterium CG_4_9_14_0_8_um_filter_41_16]PJC24663.1 MAG: hypothetical protein CO057_01640 [Candidatus Uhrbacteria bacterium CG_4_9_14_0_2_um_filter_41_50]PJE74840.1 MAG: hypothetical protein COV03_03270 [Candidatus Uhrbacteria bacterium CG10_big_fil_rev_8_21_14_0_10_41_26]